MDLSKIGKFIAEQRKKQGLTQAELAERLFITDRAVSKWETGKSMPDSSIMLDLCKELNISVNDLLSGEITSMDNYNEKLEQNLLEMVKEKEKSDKRLLTFEVVIGCLSIFILLAMTIIAAYVPGLEDWHRIVIILSGMIPCVVGVAFAIRIEQVAGYYECQKCGHRYVPSYMRVLMSMHSGRTRYMKCPKCEKRSWQKKVISKEENKEK